MVETVAPPEAEQSTAALLEECHDLRKCRECLYAVASIVSTARVCPTGIALFST